MPCCPECGSQKVWKAGFRYIQGKPIQRYLCRECGFRFSDPEFSRKNEISGFSQTGSRQICVTETKVAKNLVAEQKNQVLQENKNNTKSHLVNFSWHLKKLGRSEETIKTYANYVKNMAKLGELNDPEAIKGVIATHYKDKNTQRLACCAYDAYLKFKGGQWEKPNYKPEHKQEFIPTEKELQLAINTGHKESVIYSMFLYETGARANEAARLEWTDLDRERKKVTVKASKHGNSRILSISEDLMRLLFSLPKTQVTLFRKRPKNSRSSAFHNRMIRLAKIHNNPRLLRIHLHTFRHCKALRVYHNSHEILEVMEVLGHRKIETSYRYIRLYRQVYKNYQPKKFITKIAKTEEEALWFWDNGWELEDKEGNKRYFRKAKGC
jgi:integrase